MGIKRKSMYLDKMREVLRLQGGFYRLIEQDEYCCGHSFAFCPELRYPSRGTGSAGEPCYFRGSQAAGRGAFGSADCALPAPSLALPAVFEWQSRNGGRPFSGSLDAGTYAGWPVQRQGPL